jgi:heat shock protein HslJ
VISTAAVLALAACGDEGEATGLDGTKWIMTTYAVVGSMKDALPSPAVDITFSPAKDGNGTVDGNGGVNQYSGPYTVQGEKLTVGPLSSTRMAGDQAAMDQESAYLSALQLAASYKISGDTLTISNRSGIAVVTYKAAK